MFTLIINHQADTLIMELPCGRMQMAEHLASIGVVTPAHEIKCISEDDDPIEVKIYGNSEFEKKLASFILPTTTLSVFNSFCEMYQNIPYEDKLRVQEAVLNGSVDSLSGFGKLILDGNLRDTVSYYYCPLIATVYSRNEYGDLEDYPDEYNGSYLAPYEERIRDLIRREDARDENNLAEYFDGSSSAVAKLKEVRFSTQNVNDVLYGAIRIRLTEPFTASEEAEFRDWLEGQCSDGYGEGLEQREIRIEDGEMYVSFWNASENYFFLKDEEFDEYLTGQTMGEIE